MNNKKILLSMDPRLYEIIKKTADDNYMTAQELMRDILRKSVLSSKSKSKKGVKRGRPPKVDEPFIEYFSKK